MGIENPVHLLFIGIVALVVLGPKRLPDLAKALGHGIREFRQAVAVGSEPPVSRSAPAPPHPAQASETTRTPEAAQAPQPPPEMSQAPATAQRQTSPES